MPDAFQHQPHGAFMSFLDFLDEPSQVIKNVARGNFSAAGRHVANIAGDVVDAALPGDWIPDFRQEGDDVSSSELVGLDQKEHPILGGLTNFVGDTLLNPATYIPGAALAKGAGKLAGAAATGISKIPGGAKVLEGAEDAARFARKATGFQDTTAKTTATIRRARAKGANATSASMRASQTAMNGLNDAERGIVSDVMDNQFWKDPRTPVRLTPDGTPVLDRIAKHPDVTPENIEKVRAAVAQSSDIGKNTSKTSNVYKKITGADGKPIDMTRDDYLQARYSNVDDSAREAEALGEPSAIKQAHLTTPELRAEYLAKPENAGVTFERDAAKRLFGRAEEEGRLTSKGELGRRILGPEYAHADPKMRSQVMDNIKGLEEAFPEDYQVLHDAYKGLDPRGAFTKLLTSHNNIFKRYAVFGAFIPKWGSDVSNKMSAIWQAIATPATRGVALGQVKRFIPDLYGALGDGLEKGFGLKIPKDALGKKLQVADEAFAMSGGSPDKAYQLMEQAGHGDVAALFRNGIVDGYTRAEDLLKEISRTGWKKHFNNVMNWPAAIFRGLEDRMRLGMGLDLMDKGVSAQKAAPMVSSALFDYGTTSTAQRTASDVIPFFKFQSKAIPQAAKFMAEKPAVATAMASALTNDDQSPVYPFMEGKLNIPLGQDTQGNDEYLSGLRLPFESLTSIPNPSDSLQNFGRDVERNVVGASNPLLKTAFSAVSGEDPYFGTPYGSYDKVPMFGNAGSAGRAYNVIAGAGVAQPVTEPLRLLGQATDPRHSAWTKALDLLTGANINSVDPDRAIQQQLTQELQTNPQIKQYTSFYDQTNDPETQGLIRAYQAAKKRSKAKREAAR